MQLRGKLIGCFADDFEIADDGVLGLAVVHEGRFACSSVRFDAGNRAEDMMNLAGSFQPYNAACGTAGSTEHDNLCHRASGVVCDSNDSRGAGHYNVPVSAQLDSAILAKLR